MQMEELLTKQQAEAWWQRMAHRLFPKKEEPAPIPTGPGTHLYDTWSYQRSILAGYEADIANLLPNFTRREPNTLCNDLRIRYDPLPIYTMRFLENSRSAVIFSPNRYAGDFHARSALAHEYGHLFEELGFFKTEPAKELIDFFQRFLNMFKMEKEIRGGVRVELCCDFLIWVLCSDEDRLKYGDYVWDRQYLESNTIPPDLIKSPLLIRRAFIKSPGMTKERARELMQRIDESYKPVITFHHLIK